MNKKVRTPDCGSIGFTTSERPAWAQGKSNYDSYTFVKLSESRIVAYANDKYLIYLEEPDKQADSRKPSNQVIFQKRFYRKKKAPLILERSHS